MEPIVLEPASERSVQDIYHYNAVGSQRGDEQRFNMQHMVYALSCTDRGGSLASIQSVDSAEQKQLQVSSSCREGNGFTVCRWGSEAGCSH